MDRASYIANIQQAFAVHPIVAILGPRQCGKTTLAKQYISSLPDFNQANYFDLEDATSQARLSKPQLILEQLEGMIVIDEVQKRPELFPSLRVLIDAQKKNQRFLILGSASQELIRQSSESLAGRIQYIELPPFTLQEVQNQPRLWLRGGFPKSYLADNDEESAIWRKAYIRTFLEQDIPNLGLSIPAEQLRRFWMMLTHYHGGIFNASQLSRSLGLNRKVIQHYADVLSGTFMIRQLQPWYENIGKRQVKSAKIYFRDSGIFHTLSGITQFSELLTYPKLGLSWEGMALEEVIRAHKAESGECFFWATQAHAELDLLLFKGTRRLGFEFKYTDNPRTTKSMHIAIEDLKLDELNVIYPGTIAFPLATNIRAIGLDEYVALA